VAVSDGLDVVTTDGDGRFELVTTADREFVTCSVPAGHRIPTGPTGTAAHYRPLRADPGGEMEAVFDLEPLPGGPTADREHAFLLLADIQTEDATEMGWFHERTVPDVQGTLADLSGRETFGIACGDIMYDDLSFFDAYERGVERSGIPFFQVVGNHDLDHGPTDEGSIGTFRRRFGPGHYSFDRGAVHYVVLDDVFWYGDGYIGYLPDEQLRWLEADLGRVDAGRSVVVALHIPVLGSQHLRRGEERPSTAVAVMNRDALDRLLEPYRAHVLCGHTHECEHDFRGSVHEHVAGAVCGAWWSGPICGDGSPNGYAVYEVAGEDLRWRYKATGEATDHQMRLYPPGSDPSAPDEMVANVWDWDPGWTVAWWVDGERKGTMARRVGRDPLSVSLHEGPDLPERRTWVEPYPTGHLFYAPVPTDARSVRVEAVDRFSRRYAESLDLTGGPRP
jgi:hypothetical protein